ncbi:MULTISPECIES: flagellar hook assembly protein FlgD [Clostridium]|nr:MULTISPECIES: flagellar hook capping FlgD N-terminal domain-containing protein [Clostridium]AXB85898.1 flagellar biosynthesis protein FlgD [Clostridium butyricum]MBZ0312918.1 flagellar biosynthesis protein FlgD [Clostridium butyricum]MDB2136475.1 flagellar hook capping FlgD N-terminal domain-containing protein [Clostridium butyricum]MDB2154378.1 flagellar hook capping FlgD N-terminal domain-containing protein [Clostridium butyricum]MDB2159686.1 flagellar hook capping FlgD N-terminal domain-
MATKVTNALGYTDRGTAIVSSNTELGQNAFMNILVAELSNMDPTQDQDSTAYVTQMAEFASIEQLNNLNTTMRNFSYQQMVGQVAILNDRDAEGNNKFGLITQVFKSGTYTYATVLDAATGTYSNYEISRVIGTSDSGYTSANFETALNSNFLSAKALADSGAKAVVVETETKNVTSTDSDGKTTTTSTTVTTAKKCVIKSAYLDKAGSQVNVTVAFLDDEGNETDETKVYNYTSIVIAGNLTDEVMDEAVKNHTTVTESDKDDSTEEVSSNTKSTTEGIKAAIASYAANNQKSITQENEILSKIAGI